MPILFPLNEAAFVLSHTSFFDMDLKKEILSGYSISQKNRILAFVGSDQKKFNTLMDVFLQGPYRITQRSSWALSHCVEQHPSLVKPHLKSIIQKLEQSSTDMAIKRNILRLLQFIVIPKTLQGKISQICFDSLTDNREAIAVKVFAMTVLANICQQHPDLKNELRLAIEEHLPFSSAAFRSRASKVLHQLRQ